MQALIEVILPVFLLIGAGYVTTWRGWMGPAQVDAVMGFAQQFALPVLLFSALARLDLGAHFDPRLLISFYTGSVTCFFAGMLGARLIFGREWEDAVAIGFACLFANSLLLGLAITERAYGAGALDPNFAIISIHAPVCYGLGITTMEIVRARANGQRLGRLHVTVLRAMFRNALILGISAGFVLNLSGLQLPEPAQVAVDMLSRTALPCALFALGGVLFRYRPEGDLRIILYVCAISLLLHPAIAFGMSRALAVPVEPLRSAVITAAMAPGVNAYLFANMYGRARRVAASAVLVATAGSIVTVWMWLALLP